MDTKEAAGKLPAIAPIKFIREVVAELKKVNWPTKQETIKLTVIVIVISVVVGLFIGGLDALFVKLTSVLYTR
jgi:preprotein translocase subunit SecE